MIRERWKNSSYGILVNPSVYSADTEEAMASWVSQLGPYPWDQNLFPDPQALLCHQLCPYGNDPRLVYIPKPVKRRWWKPHCRDWRWRVKGSSEALGGTDASPGGCRADWLCKSHCLQICGKGAMSLSPQDTTPPSLRQLQQQPLQAKKTLSPCWLVFHCQ